MKYLIYIDFKSNLYLNSNPYRYVYMHIYEEKKKSIHMYQQFI